MNYGTVLFQTDFWLICSTMMPIPSGKLTNCVLSFEGAHAHCQTYELLSVSKSENDFSALDFRVRSSQHHGTEVFCAIYVRFAIVK